MRLVAQRRRTVVAQTAMHTFGAGNRKLVLQLNVLRWPTKLNLKTKALEPLRQVSSTTGEGAKVTTESTGLFVSPIRSAAGFGDPLP